MKELEIKMTKDLYVIVSKRTGKALTDRVYLTERKAIEQFDGYWDKNRYILCKLSIAQVRENNEWVDITEGTTS